MKSYSDDIPTAEELKKNTRFTEDTHQLVKNVGVSVLNHHERTVERLVLLNKKLTMVTVLAVANLIGIIAAITLLMR